MTSPFANITACQVREDMAGFLLEFECTPLYTAKNMEYTKPLYEIHQKMEKAGSEIYRKAMTGEQCAKLFANLDRSDPNIHELVDRIQFATGNGRYYTMMDVLENRGVHSPHAFYRPSVKTDSPEYVFDNGNVRRMKMGR